MTSGFVCFVVDPCDRVLSFIFIEGYHTRHFHNLPFVVVVEVGLTGHVLNLRRSRSCDRQLPSVAIIHRSNGVLEAKMENYRIAPSRKQPDDCARKLVVCACLESYKQEGKVN